MERKALQTSSTSHLVTANTSEGETVVAENRQKDSMMAERTKQAHGRAFVHPLTKGEKGGVRVPPPPQWGYLVVPHLRMGGGTAALHFCNRGGVKNKR